MLTIEPVSLFSFLGLITDCYTFPLLCGISELCPNKLWLVSSHWSPGANQASSDSRKAEDMQRGPREAVRLKPLSTSCHVSHNHMPALHSAMRMCGCVPSC